MPQETKPYSLPAYLRYFLRLGTLGFGGPIALAGAMQRDLVDERGWVKEEEYKEGLALAQLAPGPLAAQLAIYLGWLRGGWIGGTLVGAAFVLPSFLMVLALAWLYVAYQGLPWIQAAFYGIGATVIAIICGSANKLIRKTLQRDRLLWALFAVSAVVTAVTEKEILWVFVLCGLIALFVKAPPKPGAVALNLLPLGWTTGLSGPQEPSVLRDLLFFFAKAGAVVFGSGLAIVPFLHGGVVQEHSWLNERQFLDAVAVAMVTPGPVVITVAFVGALVAGPLGACVAAVGVFLPCYLMVILAAPYYQRFAKNARIKAFVDGVTASAVGALTGAVWVLGHRAIYDWATGAVFLVSLLIVFRYKKIPEPILIGLAGLVGMALRML
jgi:chromate transporter